MSNATFALLVFAAFVAAGSDADADRTTLQGTTANSYDDVSAFLPDFDGDGTVGFSDYFAVCGKIRTKSGR